MRRVQILLPAMLLCAMSVMAADAAVPDSPGALRLRETPTVVASDSVPGFDIAEFTMPSPAVAFLAPAPARKKVLDAKFLLLIAAGTGLTIADYELTQHCLARRTCVETDPMLPTSRAGMYGTNLPLNAALYFWSYKRKQHDKRLWWVAPLVIAASHAVGVGTNLRIH